MQIFNFVASCFGKSNRDRSQSLSADARINIANATLDTSNTGATSSSMQMQSVVAESALSQAEQAWKTMQQEKAANDDQKPSRELTFEQHGITYFRQGEDYYIRRANGTVRPVGKSYFDRYENKEDGFYVLKFTEKALDEVQQYYKKCKASPSFLYSFLTEQPNQHREGIHHRPEQYELLEIAKETDGHFLIMPNPVYMKFEDRKDTPETLKESDKGVALCVWFVPYLYSETHDTKSLRDRVGKPFFTKRICTYSCRR